MNMATAVRDSIRPISAQSWIVGDRLLLSREAGKSPGNIPIDGTDFSYAFREVNTALQPQQPEVQVPFPLVYDAGDVHAVWQIGDSFLKIVVPSSPHTTREHTALDTIRDMRLDLGVAIPEVLFHGEWGGRYYLIVTKMHGETLDRLWLKLDEHCKRDCIERISAFCKILSTQEAKQIGGVDGKHLPEVFLAPQHDDTDQRFGPDKLMQSCKALGMDCSRLSLYHFDLGPGNVLLDVKTKNMSVIDFENVGYLPPEWIRTKYRVCSGLDLTCYGDDDEAKSDWRVRMQRSLEKHGWPEIAEKWMEWRFSE